MMMRHLFRAWGLMMLVVLATSAVLAMQLPLPRPLTMSLFAGAAAFKGRLILCDYLELRPVRPWRRGFTVSLVVLMFALAALAAVQR